MTPAQAEADLGAISDRLRDLYPNDNANLTRPRVLNLQDEVVGGYREGLWLILAAVVVVLLIACANLASFQLARAALRHKEMATFVVTCSALQKRCVSEDFLRQDRTADGSDTRCRRG